MKALLFPGDGALEIVDMDEPTPEHGEVKIRIERSGVCGTDLLLIAQPASARGDDVNTIPGHESSGVIVEVGSGVTRRKVGERVIGYHHNGCGLCHYCHLGVPTQCPDKRVTGRTMHGSNAEYQILPERGAMPLPDDVGFGEGVLLACNFSTAYSALRKVPVDANSTVAVLGQGGVGLCVTMIASRFGARVVAIDLSEQRLALAAELGADLTLDPTRDEIVPRLRDWGGGRGVDAVIECSGSSQAIDQGLSSLAPLGTMVFVGAGGEVHAEVGRFRSPEQRLLGSSVYRPGEYEPMLNFVRRHQLPLDRVLGKTYVADDARAAIDHAARRDSGKILLAWT